jgi:hypothetical protein
MLGKWLGKNVRQVRKVVRRHVRQYLGSAPSAWLSKKSSKIGEKRMSATRRTENEEKTEIDWMDIRDRLIKDRGAIGFLSDHVADNQLCCMLMLIEESMTVTENMISFIIEKGLDEELAEQQVPVESCPFD